jgi:FkbM family methyltransferase
LNLIISHWMKLSHSVKVQLREPLRATALPLLARLYKKGYGQTHSRFQKFVSAPVARKLHAICRFLHVKGRGRFGYSRGAGTSGILFNATNTQFHSLYLPEYRYFEAETLATLDLLLCDNDVFYDVGSNWGHFSLHAASNTRFSGKIHAFEPMPSTFSDLESTVYQAGLEGQIECHPFALSDTSSPAFMHIPDGLHSGNATLSTQLGGIEIERRQLDELNFSPPSVMKVDAEGHEASIFAGGKKTLQEHKPFILFENFRKTENPQETLQPMMILQELGYVFLLPLFFTEHNGIPVHEGRQDLIPATAPEALLGLFLFETEERFFLGEQINILACHESRLEELKKRLSV